MILNNKKAYIGDVITGMALLFGAFIVIGFSIFLMITWNTNIQESSVFPQEAKDEQQAYTDTYPTMLGWIFPSLLIGLFVYTMITSYLVDVISKIWFIIGLIVAIFQSIVSGIFQTKIFPVFAQNTLYATTLQYMPGATFYFSNAILINAIWMFLILIMLYFKKEG